MRRFHQHAELVLPAVTIPGGATRGNQPQQSRERRSPVRTPGPTCRCGRSHAQEGSEMSKLAGAWTHKVNTHG